MGPLDTTDDIMHLFKKQKQDDVPDEQVPDIPVSQDTEDAVSESAETPTPVPAPSEEEPSEAAGAEEIGNIKEKKGTGGDLPLLLVERRAKTNGCPPMVKAIVWMGVILALYIAFVTNIASVIDEDPSSTSVKIAVSFIIAGLCLVIIPMGVSAASGIRSGERAVAIAAATGMLMLFANFVYCPSAFSVYFGFDGGLMTFANKEFVLVCTITLITVLANYYSTLRENRIIYTVSWLILVAIAAVTVYLNLQVFLDKYVADMEMNALLPILAYPIAAIYYLLLIVSFLISRPSKIVGHGDIPAGYLPVFVSSDHERKSALLKYSASSMVWCSLLFILSGILVYTDADMTGSLEMAIYYLVVPFVILLIISAIILKSEPTAGPASHAVKYIPLALIGMGIVNAIFYYCLEEIPYSGDLSLIIVYPYGMMQSDIFFLIREYLGIEDVKLLFYGLVALLFVSAAAMIFLKKYVRYVSILALIPLLFMVMNTFEDAIRIMMAGLVVLEESSSKVWGFTLAFGALFNLLSLLTLIGAVVTKCDDLQIRAETEPMVCLEDLQRPKQELSTETADESILTEDEVVEQPAPSEAPNLAFCPGCGKSISDLAPGLAFCPYCGRPLPSQPSASRDAPATNPTTPMDDGKDYEILDAVKYSVHVTMPKKVLKNQFRYDHLEFCIGGQTYRGQVGKTRDLRLNGGKYNFVFRQINFAENPEGGEVSTTVTVSKDTHIVVKMSKDSRYEIEVN